MQSARLPKDPTIYALGNILRRLVGFLMLPIYTRFLTPADYGVVGLLTFAMAIMEPLFGARLIEAVPKYYFASDDGERRGSVFFTALIITGCVSAVTAFASFLLRSYSSEVLFGTRAYALDVGLFGLQLLTQPLEYYGLTYLRVGRKPWTFLSVTLSKLVIQLSLNIALVVWLQLGVLGVVISSVLSSFLYACVLCLYTVSKIGVRYDSDLAKAMVRFSWPLWLSSLSALYVYQGGAYFLRIYSSLGEVGLYELAARVAAVLTFVVGGPFNQYWEAVRFKYYRDPNQWGVYSNVFDFLAAVLMATALCLILGAEPVIRVMAAPAFHAASLSVPILVIALFLASLTGFIRFGLLVGERTHSVAVIGWLTALLITGLNLWLVPRFGMLGAATALACARLVQFIGTYVLSQRNFDMGIKLRPIAPLLGLLLLASVAADFLPMTSSTLVDILERTALLTLALMPVAIMLWRTPLARERLTPLLLRVRSRGVAR